MTLSSYSELQSAVLDQLDNPGLASAFPARLKLAEQMLARKLDLAANEVQIPLDLVEGRAPLPDDYAAWRSVNARQGWLLDYVAPHVFVARYGRSYGLSSSGQGDGYDDIANGIGVEGGRPACFTILGSVPLDDITSDVSIWPNGLDNPFILVGPAWSGPISLVYRQDLPALSPEKPTNWLLAKAPDLYHYAVLMQFALYRRDAQDAAQWNGLLTSEIESLQTLDRNARWGRARMTTLEATP